MRIFIILFKNALATWENILGAAICRIIYSFLYLIVEISLVVFAQFKGVSCIFTYFTADGDIGIKNYLIHIMPYF